MYLTILTMQLKGSNVPFISLAKVVAVKKKYKIQNQIKTSKTV
jgi:hypothetical protein